MQAGQTKVGGSKNKTGKHGQGAAQGKSEDSLGHVRYLNFNL